LISFTRYQLLRLNASNSISVWPLPQNPLEECSPDAQAGFKALTSNGKEGAGRKRGEELGRRGERECMCSSKNSFLK